MFKNLFSLTTVNTPKRVGASKKPHAVIAIAFLLAILFLSLAPRQSETVDAQMKGILPFGGRIVYVQYCCNGSVLLTIQGKTSSGFYIFSPMQSMIYRYFNIWMPGPSVVGDANPGGVCSLVEAECMGTMYGHTISRIGTSATAR